MKQITFALALLLTLSASKCTNVPESMSALKDTKWNIETLAGEALQLPADVEKPWLKLSGDNLQGFNGCNQLMGQYLLDGKALSFASVGSTKMYCEGLQATENSVMEMLSKVDSFKLDKDVMKLMGAGKELATLKASGE